MSGFFFIVLIHVEVIKKYVAVMKICICAIDI